jgi:hypothetical protein
VLPAGPEAAHSFNTQHKGTIGQQTQNKKESTGGEENVGAGRGDKLLCLNNAYGSNFSSH